MLLFSLAICLQTLTHTAELKGLVLAEDGSPVSNALVVIRNAYPKQGPALQCTSCYSDCGKSVRTDGSGAFRFEVLSPGFQFSLVAGASGRQGARTGYHDPSEESVIRLTLRPLPDELLAGRPEPPNAIARLHGTVTDLEGNAIPGAQVWSRNPLRDNGRGGGREPSLAKLVLTDAKGAFQITAGANLRSFEILVVAPGYANDVMTWRRGDESPLHVALGRGASFRGRVVFNNQPVPAVKIGLVQKRRLLGSVITPRETYSDDAGQFHFERLPPNCEYTIFTAIDQEASAVLPVTFISAPEHAQRADFGDVELQPSNLLAISIKTLDGSSLPKESFVSVGRENAWSYVWRSLGQNATASVTYSDLAKETIQVIPRIPGYEVVQTVPATNKGLNGEYELAIDGDTQLELVVRRKR
ncbi:MAG: carboxypeptidase-like regulatory domain-containing protein [Planctomycetota bacterium]